MYYIKYIIGLPRLSRILPKTVDNDAAWVYIVVGSTIIYKKEK